MGSSSNKPISQKLNTKHDKTVKSLEEHIHRYITNDSKYNLMGDGRMELLYILGRMTKHYDCFVTNSEEYDIVKRIASKQGLYTYRHSSISTCNTFYGGREYLNCTMVYVSNSPYQDDKPQSYY